MKVRVADYIADFLISKGITDVFTVTGGGAMYLNDALGKKEGLRCTYDHHEQACAIAAESYARLSGKIAAVCVTSGPGGTNAITGVLGGWLDSVPMFVLSGQVKFSTTVRSTDVPLRQLGDQEFDITSCIKTMTKYSCMVTNPNLIRYHLEKAYFIATHGRKGPVWLDIPLNVQGALVDTDALSAYDEHEDINQIPQKISKSILDAIIKKIKTSLRPVLFLGEGVRFSGCADIVEKCINKLNIPVVTAWNAHDLLYDAHPLSFGRPGTVGERVGNFVVQNSDLLLVLGCRLNIRQISYNWENFAKNAYKIVIDIDKGELEKPTLNVDMPVLGDVRDFIEYVDNSDINLESKKDWLDYCRRIKEKYHVVTQNMRRNSSPVNPYVFIDELTRMLPESEIICCGNGSACVCTFQAANIKKDQRMYTNSGCASMGYDLPAAIGAFVYSKKHIVCLAGDGSLQMNIQELQTVKHNNMDITLFVLNNDGYHSIRQTQTNFFGLPLVGVNAQSGVSFPDMEKIAYAYGIGFERISSHEELGEKLKSVLGKKGPMICEVVLDPHQNFEPKLSSRKLDDGTMVSASLEDMYPFLDRTEFEENMFDK